MLKALKLKVGENGVCEIVADTVYGIGCTHQNTLSHLGTSKGSDVTYPDRGTGLLASGVRGSIYDRASAQHAANFAALDAVSFSRKHGYAEHADINLSGMQMLLTKLESQYMRFSARFTFANGEIISASHNVF